MNVLVLGCGEMARVAIEELVTQSAFDEVAVGTRRGEVAEAFLAELPIDGPTSMAVHQIDVLDKERLIRLMKGYDVVCNLAGPNYRNAVPVAKAAIGAGVPLVDASDDWEATLEILDLHEEAKKTGITIVVGLGASPGVTNIMARRAADRLDRIDEVHTAWVMRGSDPGGPALSYHLLYSLPHRAFVYENGKMEEVVPFRDGREVVEFAELGPVEVFHIGHPEPFTLSRYIPGISYADDKATFLPATVNDLIVELGRLVKLGGSVEVKGVTMDPLDFGAAYLHQTCKSMVDVPRTAALRTEAVGELDGRRTRIAYSAAGLISIGTGVPAAIGAYLLAIAEIHEPGAYPPEACVDPQAFFDEVIARDSAEVYEEFTQE